VTYPQQQFPGYPQQPAAVPPSQPMGGFVQQPTPGYGQPAPQGYPQQQGFYPPQPQYAPPAPPAPPLAQGSLDSFYNQPAVGGGKSLKFTQIGETVQAMVARDVTNGDVQQETTLAAPGQPSQPKFFRDGSPRYQLILPLLLPNGEQSTFYVKGATREVLIDAMNKAGCPANSFPAKGDVLTITLSGLTPTGFGQPRKDYSISYVRANQAGGGPNTAQQLAQAPQHPAGGPSGTTLAQPPQTVQQFVQQPQQFTPTQAAAGQLPVNQGAYQPPTEQPQATPGTAAPQAPAAGWLPPGMVPGSPEHQAFQALLGQAAQPGA